MADFPDLLREGLPRAPLSFDMSTIRRRETDGEHRQSASGDCAGSRVIAITRLEDEVFPRVLPPRRHEHDP